MKTVCGWNQCTGCMACIDICSKKAITIEDNLFAYNAVIDEDKCIGCNRCFNVCQVNHPIEKLNPVMWKQGWAKSEVIRKASSSGGFAAEIEKSFIRNGGLVCSCLFHEVKFIFDLAEREKDVDQFIGSKYIKSSPKGIYQPIKERLIHGKKVLFVGLPCQVAAVKKYTGNHENLYTIDLICHGTPSPQILETFLRDKKISLQKCRHISFRNKGEFGLQINHKRITATGIGDYYTMTFLNCCMYTENCYHCTYAEQSRVSDLTIGDSWGTLLSDLEQKKGISIVLCQSEKGKELLESANLYFEEVDLERAVNENHQLKHPSMKHPKRKTFLGILVKGKSFDYAVLRCFPDRYAKDIIKNGWIKCKTIRRGGSK